MADQRLQDVLFYSLESASKAYRRFAQARLYASGIDITIDQWLVLEAIHESPDLALEQTVRAPLSRARWGLGLEYPKPRPPNAR